MAVDRSLRFNDSLRSDPDPVRRLLAEAVQRGKVVRRHWLGIGLQEGCAGRRRSNASAYVGVSI